MSDVSPLRCRAGDRALVVNDYTGCSPNIGRLVEVRGPVLVRHGRPTWLIQPLEPWPYAYRDTCGAVVSDIVTFETAIEHPDAWLMPMYGVDRQAPGAG